MAVLGDVDGKKQIFLHMRGGGRVEPSARQPLSRRGSLAFLKFAKLPA